MSDKYEVCPFKAAGFRLLCLDELPAIVIGTDGKCVCTEASRCLDVDKRDGLRCTEEQLRQLNRVAMGRRAYQGGD